MKKSMQIQQTQPYCQKRIVVLVLILLAILFVALSSADALMLIQTTDVKITDFIQSLKDPLLTNTAAFISWFGEAPQGYLMLILSVVALLLARRRWEAAVLGASSFFAIALNVLVKIIVRYPGPTAPQSPALLKISDYTFPSGHVMFYMAFFGFICFLIASQMKHSWIRTALLIFFSVLIVFVGFFRVYLLAHWTSDVLGGYLSGGMILIISILLYQYRIKRNSNLSRKK